MNSDVRKPPRRVASGRTNGPRNGEWKGFAGSPVRKSPSGGENDIMLDDAAKVIRAILGDNSERITRASCLKALQRYAESRSEIRKLTEQLSRSKKATTSDVFKADLEAAKLTIEELHNAKRNQAKEIAQLNEKVAQAQNQADIFKTSLEIKEVELKILEQDKVASAQKIKELSAKLAKNRLSNGSTDTVSPPTHERGARIRDLKLRMSKSESVVRNRFSNINHPNFNNSDNSISEASLHSISTTESDAAKAKMYASDSMLRTSDVKEIERRARGKEIRLAATKRQLAKLEETAANDLRETQELLQQSEKKVEDLTKELADSKRQCDRLKVSEREYEITKALVKRLKEDLSDSIQRRRAAEAKITALENDYQLQKSELETKARKLEMRLQELESKSQEERQGAQEKTLAQQEIYECRGTIARLQKELALANDKIEHLETEDSEELQDTQRLLRQSQNKVAELETALAKQQSGEQSKEDNSSELQATRSALSMVQKQLKSANEKLTYMEENEGKELSKANSLLCQSKAKVLELEATVTRLQSVLAFRQDASSQLEQSRTKVAELQKELDAANAKIAEQEKNEDREELVTTKKLLRESQHRISELETNVANNQNDCDQQQESRRELEETRDALERLRNELEIAQEQAADSRRQLKETKETLRKSQDKISTLENSLAQARQKEFESQQTLRRKLAEAKADTEKDKSDLKTARERIATLENQEAEELRDAKNLLLRSQERVSELEALVSKHRSGEKLEEDRGRELDEAKARLSRQEEELTVLRNRVGVLEEEDAEELRDTQRLLRRSEDRVAELERGLAEYQWQISDASEGGDTTKTLQEELETARKRIALLQAEGLEENRSFRELLDRSQERASELESQLANYKSEAKRKEELYREKENELNGARQRILSLEGESESKLLGTQEQLRQSQKRILQLEATIRENDKNHQDNDRASAETHAAMTRLRKELEIAQAKISYLEQEAEEHKELDELLRQKEERIKVLEDASCRAPNGSQENVSEAFVVELQNELKEAKRQIACLEEEDAEELRDAQKLLRQSQTRIAELEKAMTKEKESRGSQESSERPESDERESRMLELEEELAAARKRVAQLEQEKCEGLKETQQMLDRSQSNVVELEKEIEQDKVADGKQDVLLELQAAQAKCVKLEKLFVATSKRATQAEKRIEDESERHAEELLEKHNVLLDQEQHIEKLQQELRQLQSKDNQKSWRKLSSGESDEASDQSQIERLEEALEEAISRAESAENRVVELEEDEAQMRQAETQILELDRSVVEYREKAEKSENEVQRLRGELEKAKSYVSLMMNKGASSDGAASSDEGSKTAILLAASEARAAKAEASLQEVQAKFVAAVTRLQELTDTHEKGKKMMAALRKELAETNARADAATRKLLTLTEDGADEVQEYKDLLEQTEAKVADLKKQLMEYKAKETGHKKRGATRNSTDFNHPMISGLKKDLSAAVQRAEEAERKVVKLKSQLEMRQTNGFHDPDDFSMTSENKRNIKRTADMSVMLSESNAIIEELRGEIKELKKQLRAKPDFSSSADSDLTSEGGNSDDDESNVGRDEAEEDESVRLGYLGRQRGGQSYHGLSSELTATSDISQSTFAAVEPESPKSVARRCPNMHGSLLGGTSPNTSLTIKSLRRIPSIGRQLGKRVMSSDEEDEDDEDDDKEYESGQSDEDDDDDEEEDEEEDDEEESAESLESNEASNQRIPDPPIIESPVSTPRHVPKESLLSTLRPENPLDEEQKQEQIVRDGVQRIDSADSMEFAVRLRRPRRRGRRRNDPPPDAEEPTIDLSAMSPRSMPRSNITDSPHSATLSIDSRTSRSSGSSRRSDVI